MQAIYEAILLIPQAPSEATRVLCRLQRSQPRFLCYLKTMAVELYGRYAPQTQEEEGEYETICKHLLAVFNRFVNVAFQERGNEAFLAAEEYYQWTLEILLCDRISLTSKKSLASSFTRVLAALPYQPARLAALLDHFLAHSMASANAVFVFLECLLGCGLEQAKVVESIRQVYEFAYYAALEEYGGLVGFYKDSYMEVDPGEIVAGSRLLRRLRETEYMVQQVQRMLRVVESLYRREQFREVRALASLVFFHPDLARYLSALLKLETALFDAPDASHPFGLRFIVVSNLRAPEKNVINTTKAMCLAILRTILSLTEKNFNLACTDKLLMRELPGLAEVMIGELVVCSQGDVYARLAVELEVSTLVSAMLGLLAAIIPFADLQPAFTSLTLDRLLRLTFFYARTFEEELHLYDTQPEDYFYFSYYICEGRQQPEDAEVVEFAEEFYIREKSVEFIRAMNGRVQGFHNIVLDICCDILILERSVRSHGDLEARRLFLEKYGLDESVLGWLDGECALSVFTVLIQETWSPEEKHRKMYLLLSRLHLPALTPLELYRLYVCLAIGFQLFLHLKGYTIFSALVQRVYVLDHRHPALTQAAYFFIEKLLKSQTNDKDFDVFAEKVLDDVLQVFPAATTVYPFELLTNILQAEQVATNYVYLDWINRGLAALNARITTDITANGHDHVFPIIETLYVNLMKAAQQKIVQNKSLAYPSFADDCAEYHEQVMSFVSAGKFQYFERMLRKRETLEEDIEVAYKFGEILLEMLVQQIPLSDEQLGFTLSFTLFLLSSEHGGSLSRISFRLLYQLVHATLPSFDAHTHSLLRDWMKKALYGPELEVNRACLILQQLYYCINANSSPSQQQGGPSQQQDGFVSFYSAVIEAMEKKFLEVLLEYHSWLGAVEEEGDCDVRRIREMNLRAQRRTSPITVIRLLNTILLNPYFDPALIRTTHELLRKYNFEIVPAYDLALQVLSLQSLITRSRNISVLECFRFTTELLGYNCKHTDAKPAHEDAEIADLTVGLRSALTLVDPYEAYSYLVRMEVLTCEPRRHFESERNSAIEINLMDYLSEDQYMLNLIKKLTLIRSVNSRARIIHKIRRTTHQHDHSQ